MEGTTSGRANGRKLPKPNNIFTVPTTLNSGFFRWWCVFLRPFIELSNREADVVACFLKQRYELSKVILDPAVLDYQLMSSETKNRIVEECGITTANFYVIMGSLKKKGVMTDKGITPELIPNVRRDDNGVFQLLILFKEPVGK